MEPQNRYKSVHNHPTNGCFGCGPKNGSGLQMKILTDETEVVSFLTVPPHLCGYNRIVHGGVVATILDEIMGWAGIYLLKKIVLTRTMTIDFIKALRIGDDLTVKGRILNHGDRREVHIEGAIHDGSQTLCARSEGTFALLTPKMAVRMGVMTAEELALLFDPIMER
ncbi:MAG: PaaI family thioesterase [Thermodesulfobacteriota bacterium]